MKTLKSLALLLSFAVAVPAFAEDPAPAKVVDRSSPDFVRCKKELETGSLVKKNKICRTNAEWKRMADQGNAESRKFVEDNAGRPAGN